MCPLGVERVVSTRVSLIFAGWLPQDGTFGSEWIAGLEIECYQLRCNVIAHRTDAGHSQTLAETSVDSSGHLRGLVVEDG